MGRVRNKDTLFGKRLKEMCRRNDLTQEGLSIKMNCSIDTVKNWYQGFNVPKWGELCRLCDLLGCSADYLLGREELPQHEASVIHDITGLSEKAIAVLRNDKHTLIDIGVDIIEYKAPKQKNKVDFINTVLESREIANIAFYIGRLEMVKEMLKENAHEQILDVAVSNKEAKDYYAQQLGFAIQKIFSE